MLSLWGGWPEVFGEIMKKQVWDIKKNAGVVTALFLMIIKNEGTMKGQNL